MKDDYFFKIDSPHKAYWLGFLYADGCVTSNLKGVVLDLHKKDREHLEKFKREIESPHSIQEHGNYVRLAISRKKMAEDLVNKGCFPNKTLILQYPNSNILPREYEKDFIRGYFDGDGCLCFTSTMQHRSDIKTSNKLYKRENWIIKIIGTHNFLEGIARFFPEEVSITKEKKETEIYRIKCGGNQKIVNIMDSFYKDADIYLDRKLLLYRELLNYNKTKSQPKEIV